MAGKSGSGLMLLAGAFGAAAAYYDYTTVATGLDGTGGVELVGASCLLMVLGALVVMVARGFIAGLFMLLLLLDVIGTGVAAYFLESGMIMGAMALAALGWLLRFSGRNA